MSQSIGLGAGSKSVRRVTLHCRYGNSDDEMGMKRVSSYALVRAYELKPLSNG